MQIGPVAVIPSSALAACPHLERATIIAWGVQLSRIEKAWLSKVS